MNWQLLFMALGLALIVEGLPYFVHPEGSLHYMRQLERMGPSVLRALGLSALVIGVVVLLVARSVVT